MMKHLKVGHYSNQVKGTGVSVFLFDKACVASYVLAGSAPASRELTTLDCEATVEGIDALVLTGGSAFGLGTADGVMRWCKEQNRGFQTDFGRVPIVPCFGLFDLGFKESTFPSADDAYQACLNAELNNTQCGNIGAGTGATVGKFVADATPMQGGLGYAEISLPGGLKVIAYAAVNSLGDIYDNAGKIIAGAKNKDGTFVSCNKHLLEGKHASEKSPSNTTLVAVFTNADFSKPELKRIAKVAISGMARSISPVFTRFDGDILVCGALPEGIKASENTVAAMAAEVVKQAIANSIVVPT